MRTLAIVCSEMGMVMLLIIHNILFTFPEFTGWGLYTDIPSDCTELPFIFPHHRGNKQ